ncbi:MAG: hypothetical protein AUH96_12630 [Nitrospirae bacterium 13_2_20CM_2_61_4]|nr:MAG: hypothetical protein AUH96_12630 [Nitrospirae bacterium 13_2_20CM_2_61_4]
MDVEFQRKRLTIATHAVGFFRMRKDIQHTLGQSPDVTRFCEEPGQPVTDDFGGTVHPRAHDRHTAGQRFQVDPWQSFPQGG